MMRTASAVAVALLLVAGYTVYGSRASAQTTTDPIQAGCGIPKSYGRLVSVLPGSPANGPNGNITYTVFEAEDGVIRWVAMSPTGPALNTQSPPRGQIIPAFIQRHECLLSGEWKRP